MNDIYVQPTNDDRVSLYCCNHERVGHHEFDDFDTVAELLAAVETHNRKYHA